MAMIETDYLVVGAGAAGMAFTDALIADSDADVVMVDRRHRPGGHWNDAYPFVRLHQPSAFYGVNSRVLGTDAIDEVGPNAGFYHRATAAEICDYFFRVLDEHLLPSGQVRFFGMSRLPRGDASGEHEFVSRLTGETTTVRVRRKLVDATYLETAMPSTHTPPFEVDPDARFIPVERPRRARPSPRRATRSSVREDRAWTRASGCSTPGSTRMRSAGSGPRDAWILDRASSPAARAAPAMMEACRCNVEAAARGGERRGPLPPARGERAARPDRPGRRTDDVPLRDREPGASSRACDDHERRAPRSGRSASAPTQIVMEEGSIPTDAGQVHVDCTAAGLRLSPGAPDLRSRTGSRCSRSGGASPPSTPRSSGSSRRPATTTPRRTGSARRTRIRPRPATGSRRTRSRPRPRPGGWPKPISRSGWRAPGSTPRAASVTTWTIRGCRPRSPAS